MLVISACGWSFPSLLFIQIEEELTGRFFLEWPMRKSMLFSRPLHSNWPPTIRNFPATHICFLSALPCLVWGREVSFQFRRLDSQSRISASLPNHQHIYLLCNTRHRTIFPQTRAVGTHCIFPSLPMTRRSSKISDMKQVRSNYNERNKKVKDPLGAKIKKRRQKSGFEWTEKFKKADHAS